MAGGGLAGHGEARQRELEEAARRVRRPAARPGDRRGAQRLHRPAQGGRARLERLSGRPRVDVATRLRPTQADWGELAARRARRRGPRPPAAMVVATGRSTTLRRFGYSAVRCGIAMASTKCAWNCGSMAVSIFSTRRT